MTLTKIQEVNGEPKLGFLRKGDEFKRFNIDGEEIGTVVYGGYSNREIGYGRYNLSIVRDHKFLSQGEGVIFCVVVPGDKVKDSLSVDEDGIRISPICVTSFHYEGSSKYTKYSRIIGS